MNRAKLLLIAILLLAACLRLYQLGDVPRHVHIDEVMNAYVGQFIWQNGVDLYGNPWPVLYFDNFGDYPNVVPMYLSGLSTLLLGQNEFAIRLPIAIFGVLGVLAVYYLTRLLTRSERAALFASLTMAIFPWHIVLSRATAEGITAATVFSFGLYALLRSFQQGRLSFLSGVGYGLLFLTYLLYPSYRVVLPLTLLPTFWLTSNHKQRLVAILLTILSFGLTISISQTEWGKGRFEQTSLFSTQSPVYALQGELIAGEGHGQALKARLLYNKAVMFGREFLKQYGDYFSSSFLLGRGGAPKRYYLEDQGLWYYSFALLFLVLLAGALSQAKKFAQALQQILPQQLTKKYTLYFIYLLLLSPLAAALTVDDVPNVHRAVLMTVFLSVFSGISFAILSQLIKVKIFYYGLFALLLAESLFFYNKYLLHSHKFQQIYRNHQLKPLSTFLRQHETEYDQIFITKQHGAAIYYLFFGQHFDVTLSQEFSTKLQLQQFNNLIFSQEECLSSDTIEQGLTVDRSLFVTNPDCLMRKDSPFGQYAELEQGAVVYQDNGDVAFRTYYYHKPKHE